MKWKLLAGLFIMFLPWVYAEETVDADFRIVHPDQVVASTVGGEIVEAQWRRTVANGDSIGLHRYRQLNQTPVGALLYLPGTNMNGVLKTADERSNLWLFLAARGIEVFTLDYRTHFIAHDFAGDLSFMQGWTMEAFVGDAAIAAAKIRQMLPELPLFVGGFSRGASYAYALAGQVKVDGLIALDGSFKRIPSDHFDLAAALQQFDEEGQYASVLSRRGYTSRTEMMQRVMDDATGPSMDERYESAAEHLSEVLFNAWGPGVLANTRANVSSIEVLAREMIQYDWFFPKIQNIEGRSIASQRDDPNTFIDDHFGAMEISVLYFGAGQFGAESLLGGIYSASRSGSKDVTVHVLENYGHLDVLFAHNAPEDVYQVIVDWITEKSLQPDE